MKRRTQPEIIPTDDRAVAVNRILSIAKLIRKQGTPDQAAEAIEWERQLEKRLADIQRTQLATAA